MSTSEYVAGQEMAEELAAVANAAGWHLRAITDQDEDGARASAEELRAAATSAMAAGYSLSEIAGAEVRGKDDVRRQLRGDALERVAATGHSAREAEADHHRAIVRAVRLGLSTREVASAAGVTHGTVRAISIRFAEAGAAAASGDEHSADSAAPSDQHAYEEPSGY